MEAIFRGKWGKARSDSKSTALSTELRARSLYMEGNIIPRKSHRDEAQDCHVRLEHPFLVPNLTSDHAAPYHP